MEGGEPRGPARSLGRWRRKTHTTGYSTMRGRERESLSAPFSESTLQYGRKQCVREVGSKALLSWVGRPPPVDANTGQGGGQGGGLSGGWREKKPRKWSPTWSRWRNEEHSTVVEEREDVGERETKWTD